MKLCSIDEGVRAAWKRIPCLQSALPATENSKTNRFDADGVLLGCGDDYAYLQDLGEVTNVVSNTANFRTHAFRLWIVTRTKKLREILIAEAVAQLSNRYNIVTDEGIIKSIEVSRATKDYDHERCQFLAAMSVDVRYDQLRACCPPENGQCPEE